MSGEPLLYGSATALIVVDEPLREYADRDFHQLASDAGVAVALAGALPVLDLRIETDEAEAFVADEALIARIKALNRRVLIVCGGLLEGAVTQISLNALMDGYDVFLPADLVCTAEPSNEHLFLSRITSCGGNILTHRQIILELLSGVKDIEKRKPLEALLNVNLRRGDAGKK